MAPAAFSFASVSRKRRIIMLIIMSAKPGFLRSAPLNWRSLRPMTCESFFATAVALRGASVMAAISPKISPAFTLPITFLPVSRLTSPSRSRYMRSPRKPFFCSAKMTSPCGILSTLPPALKKSRATAGS